MRAPVRGQAEMYPVPTKAETQAPRSPPADMYLYVPMLVHRSSCACACVCVCVRACGVCVLVLVCVCA